MTTSISVFKNTSAELLNPFYTLPSAETKTFFPLLPCSPSQPCSISLFEAIMVHSFVSLSDSHPQWLRAWSVLLLLMMASEAGQASSSSSHSVGVEELGMLHEDHCFTREKCQKMLRSVWKTKDAMIK